MDCKISCSFGEVVDKVTILKIKQKKAKTQQSLKNIEKELNLLIEENPLVKNNDELFDKLSKINNKLWILEDLIREKSKLKEFDSKYIEHAENIHIFNDERYEVKRKINEKYKSNLFEEKIFNKSNEIVIDENDIIDLENGKKLYTDGKYIESFTIIENIMLKYENYKIYDSFYVDLLFSYSNICSMFNKKFIHFNKMIEIMNKLNDLMISDEQKNFCKSIFATKCLEMKNYKNSYPYLNKINYIIGPNINCNNMSFFKKYDRNKTLLIYDGGGIGDKLMLFRFVNDLCLKYKDNLIKFFVNDNLIWIFEAIKNLDNLKIIGYNESFKIGLYHYHCSLLCLIKYLNLEYNEIKFYPLLKDLKVKCNSKTNDIINLIDDKTFIFNWKGNPKNMHEKFNRSMDLKYAIPLFELNNVNWIVITKDITNEEENILNKYNVKYFGKDIDNEKTFYDSISIIRKVKGLISTDTSLVHLSANLNVPTCVLLTLGCEWRWDNDCTNWYPNLKLFRQKELGNWNLVIENVIKYIKIDCA